MISAANGKFSAVQVAHRPYRATYRQMPSATPVQLFLEWSGHATQAMGSLTV